MTTTIRPMADLRHRLRDVGIGRKYLKENILPDWWDDSIAATPAGLAQVYGYLYARAGLDLHALKNPDAPIRFVKKSVKFKKAKSVEKGELSVSKSLALSVASVAARGAENAYSKLDGPVAGIRELVTGAGAHTVNIGTLLDYCWSMGIPVIHVEKFPPKAKKMEGMTAMIDGRPVIVLSKSHKRPSWQVFILAHEMGHIFHGHLDKVDVLVDYKLQEGVDDVEEQAANLFAVELLTGIANLTLSSPYLMNASKLADAAVRYGKTNNVEPGIIVLNYCKTKSAWALANAALKEVGESELALETIHKKMLEELEVDRVGEENYEWLLSITGAGRYA